MPMMYKLPRSFRKVSYWELCGMIEEYYGRDRYMEYLRQFNSEEDIREMSLQEFNDMYHTFVCEELLVDPILLKETTGITYLGESA